MATCAPIIVSGEDTFYEVSHVERMALVKLPGARGKNDEALRKLQECDTTGLGYAYLDWIAEQWRAGALPSLRIDTTRGRLSTNNQILRIGWELLTRFCTEVAGFDAPPAEWGHLERTLEQARARDPYLEAMVWGTHARGRDGFTLVERDPKSNDAIVRVEALMMEAERSRQFKFPGGRSAFEDHLRSAWEAEPEGHPVHGRVWRLPGAWQAVDPQKASPSPN